MPNDWLAHPPHLPRTITNTMKSSLKNIICHLLLVVGPLLMMQSCSGGGTATSIPASNQTSGGNSTLSDSGAGISISEGSFDKSLDITLDGNSSVDISDIGNAEAISSPVSITFSNIQSVKADAPMTLSIPFDKQLLEKAFSSGKAVYVKVKIEGDEMADDVGTGDPTWIPIIGSLNMDAGIMTIRLMASASTIHAIVVVGKELKVVASSSSSAAPSANASKRVTHTKTSRNVLTPLGQQSWAVICENDRLSDDGAGSCNTTEFDPALGLGRSPVLTLRDQLNDLSTKMSAKGFTNVIVAQMTVQDLIDSRNDGTPTKEQLQAMPDKTAAYNIAYFTNANQRCRNTDEHASVIGCYFHSNGLLVFGEEYDDPPVLEVAGDVVAHELTHAIQAAMCPSCSGAGGARVTTNKAFIEGTADFVGNYFFVGEDARRVQSRTIENQPRKWTVPLNTTSNDIEPYRTFEFYALISDGHISTLPAMFRAFEGANGQSFGHRLDAATLAGTHLTFKEAMIKAVALRNYHSINQPNYDLAVSNGNWDSVNLGVKPLAALHILYRAPFNADPASHDCQVNMAQITSDTNDNLVLIVVDSQDPFDNTIPSIDLGNGTFAFYTTNGSALWFSDRCSTDVILANVTLDGNTEIPMNFDLKTGFD